VPPLSCRLSGGDFRLEAMTMRCSVCRHACLVVVACLLLLIAQCASAEPIVRTLSNGLTVVVDEMHSSPVAAVRFYVRAGSAYESEYLGAGIFHYIEHLMGRGSRSMTAEEIEYLQEALGNQTNAYTSYSHTCYHMASAARYVDDMIRMIGDYVFFPRLDQTDIDTQRGIILREMAMGDDDPGRKLWYLLESTMFTVHPERYRVIGYPEPFKAITRDDLVKFHKRMYTTDNIVAVVVGDFQADHVLATVEECLGDVPRTGTVFPALPQEPAQLSERRAEEIDPTLTRAYVASAYRTVSLYSPDLYALDVLADILGAGASSRLVSRLRDELGLVDGIDCSSDTPVYDAGKLVIMAVCDEAKLAAAREAIDAEVTRLKSEPVTAAELERSRKQKAASLVYEQADVESWASTLGTNFLATGDVHFSRRYVDGIRKVTADDIQAVARKYLNTSNRTVVVRRAGKTGEEATAAAEPAGRPKTHRTRLDNGITLLVQEDRQAAMVSLQAFFLGGLRYETEQNAGVGGVMASLLTRGTKTRDRLQIAQALEDVGASLGASYGRNSFSLGGAALSEDTRLLLTLAADCLRSPTFAEDELARIKELTLAAIASQQEDVDTVASRLLQERLFGDHPYHLDPLGTEQSVKALTRAGVEAHYRRIVHPEGMVLAVYGDVDRGDVYRMVKDLFGDWSGAGAEALKLGSAEAPGEPVRVDRMRDQEQGILSIGFIGPTLDAPDRFALDVLDAAFSGVDYPGGRLHRKLRGDQLVYATHMVPVRGIEPAYTLIYAGTEPGKLPIVEDIVRALVRQVQDEPLGVEELERAKQMCICAQQVQLGSAASRVFTEALDELYGLGFDESSRYAEQIDKVTAADVQAAARKYMNLDRCVIVTTRPGEQEGDD